MDFALSKPFCIPISLPLPFLSAFKYWLLSVIFHSITMPGLFQKILLSAALLGLAVEGAPSTATKQQGNGPKAIYFLTNNAQNAVVALPVGCDGTLSRGSVTGTGGKGSNSIDMGTNLPAGPDALSSQSALKVSGQVRKYCIDAVSGSNAA
jgi:hypothetical protein